MVVGGIVEIEVGGVFKGVVETVKGQKAWVKLDNNRRRIEVNQGSYFEAMEPGKNVILKIFKMDEQKVQGENKKGLYIAGQVKVDEGVLEMWNNVDKV